MGGVCARSTDNGQARRIRLCGAGRRGGSRHWFRRRSSVGRTWYGETWPASRRSAIGVVPAWFCCPAADTVRLREPTMPVTTPMRFPWLELGALFNVRFRCSHEHDPLLCTQWRRAADRDADIRGPPPRIRHLTV